ncbi:MAG: hypothetical protein JO041_00920 [Acidobacteria bacterium]|nr:hypothetical protein [Acidobacteriota bacterium]
MFAAAQSGLPESVEIHWKDARTVSIPGVSLVVVVDDSIARAEILEGGFVRVFGLQRGETAAFAWVGGQRVAFRINVVQPPEKEPAPHLSGSNEGPVSGTASTSTQIFNDSSGHTREFMQHQVAWQEKLGAGQFSVRMQANDSMGDGVGSMPGAAFNLTSGAMEYKQPGLEINALDYAMHLDGPAGDMSALPNANTIVLRGGEVLVQRGSNSYEAFAGVTPSYYYLSLSGTKEVAGFTYNHKFSDRVELYSTAAVVNASPVSKLAGPREISPFNTTGIQVRPGRHITVQAAAGASASGGMAEAAANYTGGRAAVFAAASTTATDFPLNRLQMFTANKGSITAGGRYRFSRSVEGSLYYQHTAGTSLLGNSGSVSSDLLNPGVTIRISPLHTITLNYTYSEARGSTLAAQHGNRAGAALSSQFARHINNTVQVDDGILRDPLQLQSASTLAIRDNVSIPIKGQELFISFQHQRIAKSVVSLLNEELSLLSPALQQQFLQDPLGFVNSGLLPPDVLALLHSLQPDNTDISVFLQLNLSRKLQLRPSFTWEVSTVGGVQSSNKNVGYTLLYQLTPTLQLQSSLSSMFVFNSLDSQFQRTTVLSVGVQKSFHAAPPDLMPWRRWHTIHGRVFRDTNVNGAYNDGEPGLAGLKVELDDGRATVTDAQGRYDFQHVSPGHHTVQLALSQFPHNVRVTTPNLAELNLEDRRIVEVDFGVVDFARLMGSVYNDCLLTGERKTDSPAVRSVQLILEGAGVKRETTADSGGEYQFDDLPAGNYTLKIDGGTVPANFAVPLDSQPVELGPTSTLVRDIPLRALRSVAGHVYLKAPGAAGAKQNAAADFKPLAGVHIVAGSSTATTDAEGNFILRDLPAGELEVKVVPTSQLPPGMNAPTGKLKMPRDPVSIEGATIVISNPELVKYLH